MRSGYEEQLLQNIPAKPYPEKKVLAGVSIGYSIEELRSLLEDYLRTTIGYIPPVHQG